MENSIETTSSTLKNLLKKHFGYDRFLPNQEAVIKNVVAGNDAVVIMPTGGGKSLCYQLPALKREGTAVVISPLIALMKDQVDALKANGIPAAFYNSSQPEEDRQTILKQLKEGGLKLLYVAPESLPQLNFIIKHIPLSLFAIDEAHCISAWGHDFRPAYKQLNGLKTDFPRVPVIALTATADRATREDIVTQLQIPEAQTFIASFDRPNLYLDVRPGQGRKRQILDFLKKHPQQNGIIYCLSRKGTEKLSADLNRKGYQTEAYHAGLETENRTRVQENFINEHTRIVVATIAFGMGIDKSNIRFVIHYNLPKNIESYYQQIGRAGRDGQPAHTILFHSYGDVFLLRKFAEDSPKKEFKLAKLERMQQFAQALNCRRRMLLGYFGEHMEKDCGNCDNCKNPPRFFDGTILAQKICSAVARLKEKEPVNTVVDVLRGAQNAQVLDKGYQRIKTYGAVRDVSWQDLQDYVIQLVNQGVLEIWFHEKGRLVLTPLAKKVLFKGRKVNLANVLSDEGKNTPKNEYSPKPRHQRGKLFEKLRQRRTELARDADVPSFVIFADASLEDMEARLPQTKEEFADIFGVGRAKLKKYADDFLEVIQHYLENRPKDASPHQFAYGRASKPKKKTSVDRMDSHKKTLFDQLQSCREKLAEEKGVEAYQLCDDQVLKDLESEQPRTPREMRSLFKGEENEIQQYERTFLKVINRFMDQKERKVPSDQHSYNLYVQENMSVPEIALRRGLTEGTIMGHFLKMYEKGKAFDFSDFISPEEIRKIQHAKTQLEDPDELRPYFDYFDEQFPYWKIRLGLALQE